MAAVTSANRMQASLYRSVLRASQQLASASTSTRTGQPLGALPSRIGREFAPVLLQARSMRFQQLAGAMGAEAANRELPPPHRLRRSPAPQQELRNLARSALSVDSQEAVGNAEDLLFGILRSLHSQVASRSPSLSASVSVSSISDSNGSADVGSCAVEKDVAVARLVQPNSQLR